MVWQLGNLRGKIRCSSGVGHCVTGQYALQLKAEEKNNVALSSRIDARHGSNFIPRYISIDCFIGQTHIIP